MITVILVKNPFSPKDGREIKHIEFEGTLAELKEQHKITGVELLATVNGRSCEDSVLKDGDFVVLYPAVQKGGGKGKGILGIVAAVALSVVSFGVGGLVATGVWGSFAGASAMAAMGGYLAAAAIMFLGSSLIGRMTGQKVDNGSSYDNEPTYAWTGVQTMEGQNNPVALTYGLVKSGGQTIGKYTQAQNDEDYLFWLVACGEGELGISDIKLNDNDISLYKDVEFEVRSGLNEQEIISFFGDTHFTQSLSYNMALYTWYESSVQGSATEGIIVKIELPKGLYYVNDNGDMKNNTVKIRIEIKLASASSWSAPLGEQTITAATSKAVRREYRIDRITAGEYAVRVKVTKMQHSDPTRSGYQTYWTGVSSIIYDDFSYPCTALIGIKARATDQLSGSPTLSFKKWRSLVYVWNPNSGQYETEHAYNPAWACYDLVHQCRLLKNVVLDAYEYEVRGAPKELMRYDDFKAWADYCDEQNYYVNIEVVTAGDLLDVANQKIAPIGHGRVVRFGTKYGCIYAHPQEPVQMFGMGNIVEGSFREEFLKISDRANSVEVTFTNKEADYSRDVIAVYGETYNSDGYAKTAEVTMDGVTSFSQAYREGVYQLQCNKLQLRTVTFEASIDAIACTVGDVIIIAHDVPRWTNSGRVESVDGNRILLPCEVPDPTAEQILQWRAVDDTLYEHGCTVVSSENGYTTVEMIYQEEEEAVYPEQYNVFSIAESATENKLFTIQNITRAQDFTRQISCLEYNEGVFKEPENYDGSDERPTIFTVEINQLDYQVITVRKFKGSESESYTNSFSVEETGWTIQVTVESQSCYAPGIITVNGTIANNGDTFPLNRDYSIFITNAEVGSTVYMNGNKRQGGWWAKTYYIFYSDPSGAVAVNKNDLVGKVVVRDISNGLPYDGDCIVGTDGGTNQGCVQALQVDVSSVDVSSKTTLNYIFANCVQLLKIIGINYWNPVAVVELSFAFYSCSRLLYTGDISGWQMPMLTSCDEMFEGCWAVKSIDLHNWYTPSLVRTYRMFYRCDALEVLDISGLGTENITQASQWFFNNTSIKYIIMESDEIKFSGSVVMEDPNTNCKYLVKSSMVDAYRAHPNWQSRASRILDSSNFTIIHSNGQISVVESGAST